MDTSSRVAYNPVIQRAGAKVAKDLGAWQLPYGITTPADATTEEVREFLEVGAAQTKYLPTAIRTLVIPFGSGNTAAGVLYGLVRYGAPYLHRVVLVGVGPDRTKWLWDRLGSVNVSTHSLGPITHIPLHGWYADYSDKMPETVDDVVMHPTYEGKVVRYLNQVQPDWWARRDGSTGLWIVGGPIG